MTDRSPPPHDEEDPWAGLLMQADHASTAHAGEAPQELGPALRRRARRRRLATAATFSFAAVGAVGIFLTPSPAPHPLTTHAQDSTFGQESQKLIQEAANVRALARALRDPPVVPQRPMPSLHNTAQLADLMVRLTELESATRLGPEAAHQRYAQIIDLFPDTPAAEAARRRLRPSPSDPPLPKDSSRA